MVRPRGTRTSTSCPARHLKLVRLPIPANGRDSGLPAKRAGPRANAPCNKSVADGQGLRLRPVSAGHRAVKIQRFSRAPYGSCREQRPPASLSTDGPFQDQLRLSAARGSISLISIAMRLPVHHHGALGHQGSCLTKICTSSSSEAVELDDRAAAQAQGLVHRHVGRPEHHGDCRAKPCRSSPRVTNSL